MGNEPKHPGTSPDSASVDARGPGRCITVCEQALDRRVPGQFDSPSLRVERADAVSRERRQLGVVELGLDPPLDVRWAIGRHNAGYPSDDVSRHRLDRDGSIAPLQEPEEVSAVWVREDSGGVSVGTAGAVSSELVG